MKSLLPIGLILAATLCSNPTSSREIKPATQSTPDEIAKLIDECGLRTTVMANRLFNYSFNQTSTDEVLDNTGRIKNSESKLYEVYPIAIGRRVRLIYVQIAENGTPLSADKIERQRQRAAKETEELEKLANTPISTTSAFKYKWWSYGIKVEKRSGLSHTHWYLLPTDFLRSSEFFAPRRAELGGRETLVLNFRLKPGYVFDKTNVAYQEGIADYGKAMSQLAGRIWIDATDKVIVRLEASPTREMTKLHASETPETNVAVSYDSKRLADGTWVLFEAQYNSYGREDVFWKTPLKRSLIYSDFKAFKTTADVEKTAPAPSPTP
jgi:hypothetical protein